MTNSIDEILEADVIFIIGSNTNEQHPLIARRVIRAVREHGARLIVADPRAIGLAGLAQVFVRQKPGTDVALLNGMMHVILRDGLADEAFIAERIEPESYAALKATMANYPPERAARTTCRAPATSAPCPTSTPGISASRMSKSGPGSLRYGGPFQAPAPV
jgi:predicted molibdopterin-dependent oxidoreductase YjgC